MNSSLSRREFVAAAGSTVAAGAAGLFLPSCASAPARRNRPPGEKLRLGVVGVAGRGGDNLEAVSSEEIAALCDVDEKFLDEATPRFPHARRFLDFRDLLRLPDLDAVVVSTPDHIHAAVAAAALRRGLDVYCEKPLTHDIGEARLLEALARERGAVTQMGIQIHAGDNFRRVVELVAGGNLGAVRECHVFVNGTNWSAHERPSETPPAPETLRFDLWLGPAPERPYHPAYHPGGWRRYWDFGNGTMGDMACHHMDLAFWALSLRYPETIEAAGPPVHPEGAPGGLRVRFTFPPRGANPPLELTWHDGWLRPPALGALGLESWMNGVLFLGERGWLVANYNRHELGPKERWKGFTPTPPSIERSIGHHREWIEACKSRGATSCGFGYSGPLTETVLLGCLAFRTGRRLEWDGERGEIRNLRGADAWLRPARRRGWDLA